MFIFYRLQRLKKLGKVKRLTQVHKLDTKLEFSAQSCPDVKVLLFTVKEHKCYCVTSISDIMTI